MNFAGMYVTTDEGLLIVKEAHEQAKGLWSLPIGKVEEGESPHQCAQREAREETGYEITATDTTYTLKMSGKQLKSLSRFNDNSVTLHIFRGDIVGGEMQAGSDVLAVRWVSKNWVREDLSLRGEWVIEVINQMKRILS